VAEVVPILAPYKVASREVKRRSRCAGRHRGAMLRRE
jgi:hypothetical protein